MADKTLIAWTDHTFNPWIGCAKVSQGCKHCYAEALVNRIGLNAGQKLWGQSNSRRRTAASNWRKPVIWNRKAEEAQTAARVFVASLADVFEDHPDLPEARTELWQLIRETPWLDYQLLTKRPENIAGMLPDDWGTGYRNVWLGTSIEDNRVAARSLELTDVPAQVHFISYEPAIGPGDEIPLDHIEWLICGGESGPGYREMDLDWARDMRRRCEDAGTAFFFKQDSAPRTEMGIDALGEIVRNYPEAWDRIGGAGPAHRAVPQAADAQESLSLGT